MQSLARGVLLAGLALSLGCDGPLLEHLSPGPGDEGAHPDTVVEATFRFPPQDPTIHLSRPWGTSVPGEVHLEDLRRTVVFEPHEPLAEDGEYVARLHWAGAESATVWSFRVGDGRHLPQGTMTARPSDQRSGILRACPPDERCFSQSPPPLSSVP